ncbi:MAG: non-ribosomal peptide synthetase, partial [Acidobacteria bacterium]|nr:non-ribosomal peptide synthetase [Acidobacteriota bacterium]
QEGMLFHCLYQPDVDLYLVQITCELLGDLDPTLFRQAWQQVARRNPALRTAYRWQDLEAPLQVVRSRVKVPVAVVDWRPLSDSARKEALTRYLEEDRQRGFDLSRAPLLRFLLARKDEQSWVMVATLHQSMVDGWSLPELFQEFTAFYGAAGGELPELPPRRPYRDYIAWLEKQDRAAAEAYWRQRLAGFTEPTPLIEDGTANAEGEEAGEGAHGEGHHTLERGVTEALEGLARRHRVTPNVLVQGAWGLLLGRYAERRDVVFGVTVSGRPVELEGVEQMIGLFINTLPLRVQLPRGTSVGPWLKGLMDAQLELQKFEYSALPDVQRWSEVPAGQSLFESFLVFQNEPLDISRAVDAEVLTVGSDEDLSEERSHYALNLVAYPGERLSFSLEFDGRRHSPSTIDRMLHHLGNLLAGMTAVRDGGGEVRIEEISLLSPTERHQLAVEWNGPALQVPVAETLHQVFTRQARSTPEAGALTFEGETL